MIKHNRQNIIFKHKISDFKIATDILRILLVYALLWGGSFVIGRLIFENLLKNILDEGMNQGFRKIILCGFQVSIFFLWVKFVEKNHIMTLGFSKNKRVQKFLIGFVIGISSITIITIALWLVGDIQLELRQENKMDIYTYLNFSIILLGWFIQSASEEISIRGWLIPSISKKYSAPVSIITTSIVFGILHLFSPDVTILSFTNLVLSGVFFALYAIKQNCIWGVWGCHFGWNLSLGNIYGFNVSGLIPKGYMIFKAKVIDYNFLTGGQFGPEEGLLVTILLCIGIVVLLLKNRDIEKKIMD